MSDTLGPPERRFCPPAPGDALVRWLWLRTPPGAPVVPISPEARADPTRYRSGPGFVPKVAGQPLSTFPDRRQEDARAEVEGVAPGVHREPGTHRPRWGMAAWSIESAHDHDLRGLSYVKLAELQDYTDFLAAYPERSRSAERRVTQGRELLHNLGGWPWALSERGVLPARWWEEERFARALAGWFREATLQCLSDALRAVELANSDEGAEPVSDDRSGPMAVSETSWEGARLALRAAAVQEQRDAA
jgi:hypothetical protein